MFIVRLETHNGCLKIPMCRTVTNYPGVDILIIIICLLNNEIRSLKILNYLRFFFLNER